MYFDQSGVSNPSSDNFLGYVLPSSCLSFCPGDDFYEFVSVGPGAGRRNVRAGRNGERIRADSVHTRRRRRSVRSQRVGVRPVRGAAVDGERGREFNAIYIC